MSPAELMALNAPAKDDGFYLVVTRAPASEFVEASLAEAASLLRLKVPDLNRILNVGQAVPLGRVATGDEAAQISEKLRALGMEIITLAHQHLHLDVAAKKIRALGVSDDSVTGIPSSGNGKTTARWEDVTLLVSGRLLVNRQETEERKRRGRKQMVDSRHLSADESVLDLYMKADEGNWRINANSFDFSCLGVTKGPTTFENFAALIALLRDRAVNAQFDDSYNQARPALATVWPVEEQTRKGEWRRSGAGKYDVATVTTTDNEAQFTRYSRLRQFLRLSELNSSK